MSLITCFILTEPDREIMWESLVLASIVSDEMFFVGSTEYSKKVFDQFKKIKKLDAKYIDELDFGVSSSLWNMVLYSNELIHESCHHFLRDITTHHSDKFDSVGFKIAKAVINEEKVYGAHEDIRIAKAGFEDSLFSLGGRVSPAGLMPYCLLQAEWGDCSVSLKMKTPKIVERIIGSESYLFPFKI